MDLIHIILLITVEGLVLRKRAGLVAAGPVELVDLVVAVDMLAVAPMYLVKHSQKILIQITHRGQEVVVVSSIICIIPIMIFLGIYLMAKVQM